jgi:2-iminobutanoate/2-iminopropanoate deaminase
MKKQIIDPPQLHDGRPFGMSQAVIDTASATIYISGQVDWDKTNKFYAIPSRGNSQKY